MKITKFLLRIFVIYMIISMFSLHSYALEKETHKEINEYIAKHTIRGFSLDGYLKAQLGFTEGKNEFFNNKKVFEWLGYGGKKEDEPAYIRSCRHFHDPLESWDNAGLKGIWDSSIIWGQRTDQWPGGHYSWQDVRDYFHLALTSENQTTRDYYFAETFRGLGQQMHLVEDASVPLHTRDDIHIIFNYEGWVKEVQEREPDTFSLWLSDDSRYGYDKSILNIDPNPLAPVPIARIIDTDKYTGANPGITISEPVGIAEYSNANFFSNDTAFRDFPYPDWDSVEIADYEIQDPRDQSQTIIRQYYEKIGDGDTGYRLATVGFLKDYVLTNFPDLAIILRAFERPALDANVYQDYAERLIPRAVGYSAGLLDYFFRGKIQVASSLPVFYDNGIYSLLLNIKNITHSQETMSDGHFSVVVRYTPTGGNPDGSEDIFVRSYEVASGVLQYGGEGVDVQFNLPVPVPIENYESVKCILTFRGTLGNESRAVIGKSFMFGQVKINEEWDNGLEGNHPWTHTTPDQNPDNGSTSNVVENGILIKDNIRFIDHDTARFNSSYLDLVDSDNPNGLVITPNTYLQFKIDDLSINEQPPAPEGETSAWQYLSLRFNNGLGLQFTQEGQGVYWGTRTAYYTFGLGWIIVDNIYSLFQNCGITIPEPLYLEDIFFSQQLGSLAEPSTVEHCQYMEIDFIRIIEKHEEPE